MKGIKKFKGTEMQLYEFIYSLSGDSDSSSVQIQLEGKIKDIFKICDALESTQIFYSLDLRKIISFEGNIIDVGYQPPFSFRNLDFLKELYLPDTVKRFYRNGIENCPNLTKLRLPINLSEIANKSIVNCPKLVLYLHKEIQHISPKMFWNVGKVVFSKFSFFKLSGSSILSKDGKIYYGTLDSESKEIQIPAGVEKAATYSFWAQKGIVRFPSTLKEISNNCFSECECTLFFEDPMKVKFPTGGFTSQKLIVPQYEETVLKQEKIKKFKERATSAALDQRYRELEKILPQNKDYRIRLSNPIYSKECILCEVDFPKEYLGFTCHNKLNFYIPILEGFEEQTEFLMKILKNM